MRIEEVILSALANDTEFIRKAAPYLKEEYFANESEKVVYALLDRFVKKYNRKPSRDSILIEFEELDGLSEDEYKEGQQLLTDTFANQYEYEHEWLMENAEKFCQDRAVDNALLESIKIREGDHKTLDKGSIPTLLSKALAVCFDHKLGHDYFDDAEARYEYYAQKLNRIPTELNILNRATGGGLPRKSLCVYVAPSNVGKSAVMAAHAGYWLSQGYNVAVFTMELSEEEWTKRIDANRFQVAMNDLGDIPKDIFMKKIEKIKSKTRGRFKIKEYAPKGASVTQFELMLDEWKLKDDFVPDIIIVDYIGITASASLKMGNNVNTNTYFTSVAEELRAMAIKHNALCLSAAQANRAGYDNSDAGAKEMADSIGIFMTADWAAFLITNDELQDLNQIVMSMIKTRFGDKKMNRWVAGFDFPKMTLFDVEQNGQLDDAKDNPQEKGREKTRKPFGPNRTDGDRKDRFAGFKLE
jgi:archaellum biogenesis ATPase FlaH